MRDLVEFDPSAFPIPVGPHVFTLRMVAGPLINDEGAQCMVRIDMDACEILVSAGVPTPFLAAAGAAAAARAWQRLVRLMPVSESVT